MKKFIYGLLLALGIIAFSAVTKTNASTYTFHMSSGVNDSGYSISSPTDLYMSGDYIVSAYRGNNGILYVIVNHGYDTSYYGTYKDNSRRDVHFVGYSTQRMYFYTSSQNYFTSLGNGLYALPIHSNATVTGVTSNSAPFFNNQTDAKNFALGLDYNSSSIIGGTVPTTYSFANDTDYVPKSASTYMDTTYTTTLLGGTLEWSEGYTADVSNVPPNFHHIAYNIHYKMPTRASLYNPITSNYISQEITWRGFLGDQILWRDTVNSGNYLDNGITYEDYIYPLQLDTTGKLLMSYAVNGGDEKENLFRSSVLHNAIKRYYNIPDSENTARETFTDVGHASMFAYIDFIEVHYVAYNESSHKYISYPSLFYYPDLLNYDGTIFRKRDIDSTPASTKPSGDISETDFNNVGNVTNYPSKDSDYTTQLQNLLDNIVIDNGDTVINNYIDGVGGKLDEWWNDGDIDINENIGNLYSLLKSVSNIGLLFGLIFNGFIPSYVLAILGFALLLIPIVLIIKLVRG